MERKLLLLDCNTWNYLTMCKQIELLVLYNNSWNNLTDGKQMNSGLIKILPTNYSFTNYIYLIYICINRIWHEIAYNNWYTIKSAKQLNLKKLGWENIFIYTTIIITKSRAAIEP